MKFTMTTPCDQCPFLRSMSRGFTLNRLKEFAASAGAFPCHKTAKSDDDSGEFHAKDSSVACAGALIFNEKRGRSSQMMRIAERLRLYDHTRLNMDADVR